MVRYTEDSKSSLDPREMHKAICSECGKECEVPFKPEEGKNVRCNDCFRQFRSRRPRRNFQRRFNGYGQRTMHKAVCAECGKECEVPFKPVEGKPVLCNDCFRKKKESQEQF